MRFRIAFFAALLWITVLSLDGQEFRALISGQVIDPLGAGVPGAVVTAVKVDTRQAYSAKSDAAGVYSLLYLLPGQYTVTVDARGFQKTVYDNVILETAQKLNLNVTLSVGSIDQQVTVSAFPGLLETATASVGGVVDQTKVENMPSTGRQVWMDLAFAQGVRMTSGVFDTTPRNNGDRYSVNGAPTDSNSFYLNGAPVSDQGVWYFVPNQDAVQELQGGTSYDAQYGRAAGGSFNVNVKSGTNHLRGAFYDHYGNEALNANFFQSNLNGIPKGLNIRNTFGGVLGGPIRKDKTFFFGSYEGFRQNYPNPAVDSVPPASWKKGDFSQSGYSIFDPLTTTCVKSNAQGQCSQYGRNQFPNNVVPANRISAIGQAILNLYPDPTSGGFSNNYAISGPRDFLYDQYLGRVDQYFSQATRLYALVTSQRNLSHNAGNHFPNAANTASVPSGNDYNAIAALTRVLSPSLVADVKLSYGRYTSSTLTGTALQENFTGDKIGGLIMPVVPTTTHLNVVPQVTVTGFTTLIGNTQNGSVDNDWDFSASLAQTRGRHNLHYGFEFMDVQSADSGIPGRPNGTFGFNVNWTQSNPQAATIGQGLGIAGLLLGYPTSGSLDWNSNLFVSYHYYGLFAQDDFKLRKNLTLNLGLRWDVNTSPFERFNRINAGFCFTCKNPSTSQIDYSQYPGLQNPLLGGLQFAGVGQPSAPFEAQLSHWQPRLGISWAITPKWVVRAGYGTFYSWGRLDTNSTGFNQSTPNIASLDGSLTPTNYFLSGRPYPSGILAPNGSSLGLATQAGQGITYNSLDRQIPFTQHWSIGFQRALPMGTVVDVEYVGSHTHGLGVSTAWDTIASPLQASCFRDNSICNTNVPNPFFGVLPVAAPLGSSATVQAWQLMRPWPLFNGITQSDNPAGESDFHSAQIRVERKIASLDFVVNYTYANWMEETSYLNNGAFRDAKLWRGLDSADRRHFVSFNSVWQLPFGKGRQFGGNASGVLGAMISHWLLDSTIVWGTGTPLAIPNANFYGPGCTSYVPPDGQNQAHWINNDLSCYHNLLPYEPRTAPLNIGYLRNPGMFEWNAAMHKRFALPHEGMFVQFRMEAVNAANHPNFGAPNNTITTRPAFVAWQGWTGFGTLPLSQSGPPPRAVILSLKVIF
jgi:hypothetical protein